MATTLAKISIKDSSTWNTYLNLIYPVGSVYMASNNTSPASRFGGTWNAISNSRYLRFANTYTTGGQSDNKISVSALPSHSHNTSGAGATWIAYAANSEREHQGNKVIIDGGNSGWGFYADSTITASNLSGNVGGGQHTTLPTSLFTVGFAQHNFKGGGLKWLLP